MGNACAGCHRSAPLYEDGTSRQDEMIEVSDVDVQPTEPTYQHSSEMQPPFARHGNDEEERRLFRLFDQAMEYNISDADSVRRMVANLRGGRFDSMHYTHIFRPRIERHERLAARGSLRSETAAAPPPLRSENPAAPSAASEPPPGPVLLPPLVKEAKANAELRSVLDDLSAGERHAECCICFEYLYEGEQATLVHRGTNACAHFFHEACARGLLPSARATNAWATNAWAATSHPCPIC